MKINDDDDEDDDDDDDDDDIVTMEWKVDCPHEGSQVYSGLGPFTFHSSGKADWLKVDSHWYSFLMCKDYSNYYLQLWLSNGWSQISDIVSAIGLQVV